MTVVADFLDVKVLQHSLREFRSQRGCILFFMFLIIYFIFIIFIILLMNSPIFLGEVESYISFPGREVEEKFSNFD